MDTLAFLDSASQSTPCTVMLSIHSYNLYFMYNSGIDFDCLPG